MTHDLPYGEFSDAVAKCLARFEGRDYDPDGPLVFAWHVHHDELVEPLTEPIANRIDWIIKRKPVLEIPIRLEWLRLVKGELPKEFVKASAAYKRAWVACLRAWAACDQASMACAEELEALHAAELPGCPWNGTELVLPKEGEKARE